MIKWGVDDYGKKYVKWGEKEWLPACPEEEEEEKEEKKKEEEEQMEEEK